MKNATTWIAAALPDEYEFSWPEDRWLGPDEGPTWGEAYYRLSFHLPDPARVTRAALLVRSRVRSDVRLNGLEIKRCAHWLGTYEIELTPFLKAGKNTLAIRCLDRDMDRPFLAAAVAIRDAAGTRLLGAGESTGHSWRAVPRSVPAEWDQVWFDDRAWREAVAPPADQLPKPTRRPVKGPRPFEFVKSFTPPPGLVRAEVRVTALGGYRLSLDGRAVGDAVLTPGWTAYDRRLEYQTYDVTHLLEPGRVAELRIFVASLWWGLGLASFAEEGLDTRLKACLRLEMTTTTGATTVLTTDPTWLAAPCAVLQSSLYHGEVHDYTQPQETGVPVEVVGCPAGLARKNHKPSAATCGRQAGTALGSNYGSDSMISYSPPAILRPPCPNQPRAASRDEVCDLSGLVPAAAEPIRVIEERPPATLRRTASGSWIADFGQNLAGWPSLRTPVSDAPLRLHLQTAERTNPDGSLNLDVLRTAKSQDIFHLPPAAPAAGVPEWLEPRLSYHGFRYVEIHGWPAGLPLTPADLRFCVVHADLRAAGDFHSSSPLLDRIFSNFVHSLRSNFHAVPSDCPQRDERLGWMADAGNIPHAIAWCYDISRYFDKWVVDMEDSQAASGYFPNFAPFSGLTSYGASRGAPGWADAGVNVPWALYERYGDLSRLRDHYPAMRRHVETLEAEAVEHLLPSGGWGDWLAVENSPAEPLGSAFFFRSTDQVAQAAEALGLPDEAARFRSLAGAIAAAYHKAYFDPATGDYANGTQTMNILPVALGITPPELRAAVVGRVVADLAAHEDHLTTGFIGTTFLIPTLAAFGHHDLVLRILLQRDFPSWGRIIDAGSTTITEAWNAWLGDDFASHNHFNLGSVIEWYFTGLLGLQPGCHGLTRFRFCPCFPDGLDSASGHHDTPAGRVAVAWHRGSDSHIDLSLEIPPGITATIDLPGIPPAELAGPATAAWKIELRQSS